jgi:hypothetical protein
MAALVKHSWPKADTCNVFPSELARDPEAFAAWQREQAIRRHLVRHKANRIGAVAMAALLHVSLIVWGWNAIGNYQEAEEREERAASYERERARRRRDPVPSRTGSQLAIGHFSAIRRPWSDGR